MTDDISSSRFRKATLFVLLVIGALYGLSRMRARGPVAAASSVSTAVTGRELRAQQAAERIRRLTKDSIPTLSLEDLSDLVAHAPLTADTAMVSALETAYESRHRAFVEAQRRDREARLLSQAKSFRFDDGSACTRVTATKVHRLLESHDEWSDEDLLTIACGGVSIGMTAEQVRTSWGRPGDVNRTTYATHVHEQWVYGEIGHHWYAYLDDGILTATQD